MFIAPSIRGTHKICCMFGLFSMLEVQNPKDEKIMEIYQHPSVMGKIEQKKTFR